MAKHVYSIFMKLGLAHQDEDVSRRVIAALIYLAQRHPCAPPDAWFPPGHSSRRLASQRGLRQRHRNVFNPGLDACDGNNRGLA